MQSTTGTTRSSWWSRHWIAVLGCGCLTSVFLAAAFVGLLWLGVTRLITSSEVVGNAVRMAGEDPAVVALLGTPLHTGWMVRGNIHIENDSGEVNATVPLIGPRARGDLRIIGVRRSGEWHYTTVELRSGDRMIDLLVGRRGPVDL